MTVPIVFIQVQNTPQSYMHVAIEQARRWNPDVPIIVLSDILAEATAGETWIPIPSIPKSEAHLRFLDKTKDNEYYNTFRAGFWRVTAERLFVLEEWMRSTGTTECIHLENDILFYESVAHLLPKLRETSRGMSAGFHGQGDDLENQRPQMCFSIMYCCDVDALLDFCRFLATPSSLNEMERGGDYWLLNEETCSVLPTAPPGTILRSEEFRHWIEVPSWGQAVFDAMSHGQFIGGEDARNSYKDLRYFALHDDALVGMFDAATHGQFIGGEDPKNGKRGPGFVNLSCEFRTDQFTYEWDSDAGRPFPYILHEGKRWKIWNLHIHSKRLSEFI